MRRSLQRSAFDLKFVRSLGGAVHCGRSVLINVLCYGTLVQRTCSRFGAVRRELARNILAFCVLENLSYRICTIFNMKCTTKTMRAANS